MMPHTEQLYTPVMRERVAQAFVDLGIIANADELPRPAAVLYGESEEATTCYYFFKQNDTVHRLVAAKCASDRKRALLWDEIERFRISSAHTALLPVERNTRDQEIIAYDDGKWLSSVLREKTLIGEDDSLPEPSAIVSGRAGISRVYWFQIPPSKQGSRSSSWLVKFSRPDRVLNEWRALGALESDSPREIVWPIRGNRPEDGIIIYPSFGGSARSVVGMDEFLLSQPNPKHVKRALDMLHTFLSHLYISKSEKRSGETWGALSPDLEAALSTIGNNVRDLIPPIHSGGTTWSLKVLGTEVALTNPLTGLRTRLATKPRFLQKANCHGDLQTTNILLALAEHGEPTTIAVIDVEKLETEGPIAWDLAGLEADFVRSVYPQIAKEWFREHGGYAERLALQALIGAQDRLAGRPDRIGDVGTTELVDSVTHFIFESRRHSQTFLRYAGEHNYDPTEYFHFLLFHYLLALSRSEVHIDPLKKQLVLIAASLAEETLRDLAKGFYASEGRYTFPDKWKSSFVGSSFNVEKVLHATAEQCGQVDFLSGGTLVMKKAFCEPIVRGLPVGKSATEFLIQREFDKHSYVTGTTVTAQRRITSQNHRESFGSDWPIVSLNSRLREHCAFSRPDSGRRSLVLIDEPGGGKTTTLQNITWRVAERSEPFSDERRTPMFIRLGDWAKHQNGTLPLLTYLSKFHGSHQLGDWPTEEDWYQELARGGLFLAFDGLDELGPDSPLASTLQKLIPIWIKSNNCVLLTCRARSIGAYRLPASDFEILRIHGLDEAARRQFIQNYPSSKKFASGRLMRNIEASLVLHDLATNPFMLDVLCYLASSRQGDLPATRNEIIEKAVYEILRDGIQKAKRRPAYSEMPDPRMLENLLARTALEVRLLETASKMPINWFSYEDFLTSLKRVMPVEGLPDINKAQTLTEFFASTRLLSLPSEASLHRIQIGSFAHGLFLEWFAAQGIKLHVEHAETTSPWLKPFPSGRKDFTPEQLISEAAFDSTWLETLILLPSRLQQPLRFFEILLSVPDDIAHARTSLALRSLAELPQRARSDHQIRAMSKLLSESAWELAKAHWEMGTAELAPNLLSNAANISGLLPEVLRGLTLDLNSSKLPLRVSALEAITRIGLSASTDKGVLQALKQCLQDADGSIRRLAGAALGRIGPRGLASLIEGLDHHDWFVGLTVCEAIAEVGPSATLGNPRLIPRLLKLASHRLAPVRATACEALGRLEPTLSEGAKTMEILIKSLREDEESVVRARSAQALGRLGQLTGHSRRALDVLLKAVVDSEEILRAAAVDALINLRPAMRSAECNVIVRTLTDLVQQDYDAPSLGSVCEALGSLGPRERSRAPLPTIEAIGRLVASKNVELRIKASEALGRIGATSDPHASDVLLLATRDKDWTVRTHAVAALKNIGGEIAAKATTINKVQEQLKAEDWYVRSSACEVLGLLWPYRKHQANMIVDSLTKRLADPDPMVCATALDTLAKLDSRTALPAGTVEHFVKHLHSGEWYLRAIACESVERLPLSVTNDPRIVDAVLACLDAPQWSVRASACAALGRLRNHKSIRKRISGLIVGLCDPQEPVRVQASRALALLMDLERVQLIPDSQKKRFTIVAKGLSSSTIPFPRKLPSYLQSSFVLPLDRAHAKER
jgi:HEAT repeat protein